MNGIWVIFGILSIYIIVVLVLDRMGGPLPLPYPWFTKKHQQILNLQRMALALSWLIFLLFFIIQPKTRNIWLLGTIGIYYAGISAIFRHLAAGRFGKKGNPWPKPTTGIHALTVGIFWIGIALCISYVILFGSPERPFPNPASLIRNPLI